MSATKNLANIPFESLIGGPMEAAVRAQAMAARTSVEFIESVGFLPATNATDPSQVRYVTFKYAKLENGVDKNFSLTVPVLSIVPMPYLRIDEMTIDFTAKLNDVVTTDETNTSSGNVSGSFSAHWGWGRAQVRGGYSSSHKKETKSQSSTEYTMNIHVRAVQDELPGGMAKVLNILESVILEKEA